MIIFLDAQGNIVVPSLPEAIGRNSNDVGIIYIVAPLANSARIYLTFTLPNGQSLFGNLATPAERAGDDDTRQAATYLFKVPEVGVGVWRYKIPSSVTRYSGTVQYTIITITESMRGTSSGSFCVSHGGKLVFPEDPPENAWDKLFALWSEQGTDIEEIISKLWGEKLEKTAPGEGSVAFRANKNENDIAALEKEIYGEENTGESDVSLRARMSKAEETIAKAQKDLADFDERLGASEVADVAASADLGNRIALQLKDGNGNPVGGGARLSLGLEWCPEGEYKLKAVVRGEDGEVLAESNVIDLPIETMIADAKVSDDKKNLTLTFKNGQSVSFSVSELLAGLVTEESLKEALGKKANVLGAGIGTRVHVYYSNGSEGSYGLDNVCRSGKIPVYTSNPVHGTNNTGDGYLTTATPVYPYHCANMKYVDDRLHEKVGIDKISLGLHTDGLTYVFIDGAPTGNGIALPSGTGDIVGNVDSENNIVLTGDLTNGTYTIKYEMEDGSVIDIGELVLANQETPNEPDEPTYTNFFDETQGFRGRLSSTGENRTDALYPFVTNYIGVQKGDVVAISGCDICGTMYSGDNYFMSGYNADKANVYTDNSYVSNDYWTVDFLTDEEAQFTVLDDSIAYFRFVCCHPENKSIETDTSKIIINIKRDGAWL